MNLDRQRVAVTLCILVSAFACSRGIAAVPTAMKVSTHEIIFPGKQTLLGQMLLPDEIILDSRQLLAAPIRLQAEPLSVFDKMAGHARIIRMAKDSAQLEWVGQSSGFEIRSLMTADSDGFCWYEISLTPKRPTEISSLRITIPRHSESASIVSSRGSTSASFDLGKRGGTWNGEFTPSLWVGDERGGIAWCCESDEGRMLDHSDRAVRIKSASWVVNCFGYIVDHPVTLDSPVSIKFGLQTTPADGGQIRHVSHTFDGIGFDMLSASPSPLDSIQAAGVKTVICREQWKGQGDLLVKLIDECHRRGMNFIMFVGPDQKRSSGTYDGLAEQLSEDITNLASGYKIDGILLGVTNPESTGSRKYPVLAVRSLASKVSDTLHRVRPAALLEIEPSQDSAQLTAGVCGSTCLASEGLSKLDDFDSPLAGFGSAFGGLAGSSTPVLFCGSKTGPSADELIALSVVNGVEIRPGCLDLLKRVSPIWRTMDRFSGQDADRLSNREGSAAEVSDSSTYVSGYAKKGSSLLVVAHLSKEKSAASIRLKLKNLNLTSKSLSATDALTGDSVKIEGTEIHLNFDGFGYRLIELHSEVPVKKH